MKKYEQMGSLCKHLKFMREFAHRDDSERLKDKLDISSVKHIGVTGVIDLMCSDERKLTFLVSVEVANDEYQKVVIVVATLSATLIGHELTFKGKMTKEMKTRLMGYAILLSEYLGCKDAVVVGI